MDTELNFDFENITEWNVTPKITIRNQFSHLLKHPKDGENREKFLEMVCQSYMCDFYETVAKAFNMSIDRKRLKLMKQRNEQVFKKLDEQLANCRENMCESDVRDSILRKVGFLSRIGDFDLAIMELRKLMDKPLSLGYKLDVAFHKLRIGFWKLDHDVISQVLSEAHQYIEDGGDWDRRNKLKVYEGLFCLCKRDFVAASVLFLETVATFSCAELVSFEKFIEYCVICCSITLKRPDLYSKIIRGAEIQEIIYYLPDLKSFVNALYDCDYNLFFVKLACIEQCLEDDRFIAPHSQYFARAMRLLAYKQLLKSYKSVTLQYMAKRFGVTVEFIDRDLYRFISSGSLSGRINKINGSITTETPDSKNTKYQETIKHGDILLQRTQKLCNFINV